MSARELTAQGRAERGGPGLLALWFGMLGPPVIWLIRLSASYVLVPFVCRTGWLWLLNGVTVAALAGTVGAGIVAYGAWRYETEGAEGVGGKRTRFMGLVGVLTAALFFAVIVAEGLANIMVDPCLTGGAPL